MGAGFGTPIVRPDVHASALLEEKVDHSRMLIIDALPIMRTMDVLWTARENILQTALALLYVLRCPVNPSRHAEALFQIHVVVGVAREAAKGSFDDGIVVALLALLGAVGRQADVELGTCAAGCLEEGRLAWFELKGLDVDVYSCPIDVVLGIVARDMNDFVVAVVKMDTVWFGVESGGDGIDSKSQTADQGGRDAMVETVQDHTDDGRSCNGIR